MSLVNQMLKDLARRRDAGLSGVGLRPASLAGGHRIDIRWLGAGALAIVLGLTLFAIEQLFFSPAPADGVTAEPITFAPVRLASGSATVDGRVTRLALQFSGSVDARWFTLSSPDRLVLDLLNADPGARPPLNVPAGGPAIRGHTLARGPGGQLRLSIELESGVAHTVETPATDVVVVTFTAPEAPAVVAAPVQTRASTAATTAPQRTVRPPAREPAARPEPVQTEVRSDPILSAAASVSRTSPPPQAEADAEEVAGLNFPLPEGTQERTLRSSSPRQRAEDAFTLGVRLLSEGRRAQAEIQFRAALSHDASLHDARIALANLLGGSGQSREAEAQLQEGLRLAPGNPQLADRYARMLMTRNDLAGAIGVLTTAPPPVEEAPEYHALLAALQQRAGNHRAAAESYAALVGIDDGNGLWWMGLGISREALSQPAAALAAYRRAATDPRLTGEVARFVRDRISALRDTPVPE